MCSSFKWLNCSVMKAVVMYQEDRMFFAQLNKNKKAICHYALGFALSFLFFKKRPLTYKKRSVHDGDIKVNVFTGRNSAVGTYVTIKPADDFVALL